MPASNLYVADSVGLRKSLAVMISEIVVIHRKSRIVSIDGQNKARIRYDNVCVADLYFPMLIG